MMNLMGLGSQGCASGEGGGLRNEQGVSLGCHLATSGFTLPGPPKSLKPCSYTLEFGIKAMTLGALEAQVQPIFTRSERGA